MARRHTPYYHHFVVLGGELVDRIGFDSALKFSSTEAEHKATREKAGLYEVYYQVLVDVKGADAEKLLQGTLVNNVERMVDGKPVGTVTSADRGYFLGRSLALGYLPPTLVTAGARVTVTAKAGGAQGKGEILVKAPYDPEMTRLKG